VTGPSTVQRLRQTVQLTYNVALNGKMIGNIIGKACDREEG
jgi:hypothetical protein